jgi:putative transposase
MDCDGLRDDQWERIKGFVPGGRKGKRGPRTDNRKFLAIRRPLARSTGTAWRLSLGEAALLSLDRDGRAGRYAGNARPRGRSGMADDRQHDRAGASACCRGARRGQRGADAQGLGRSRGGLSTKIHAATEALGLPIRLIASPGQRNDIAFAHDLIDGIQAEATIADEGYDADHLAGRIVDGGSEVVIPPKRNRKHQRFYDTDLYKERNRIERFFNRLKAVQARRHAIRQAACQLHGLRQTCRYRHLATLNRHYGLAIGPLNPTAMIRRDICGAPV